MIACTLPGGLLLALFVTPPPTTVGDLASRRLKRSVVNKVADAFSRQNADLYGSTFLGVTCVCKLHRRASQASLTLSGLPIGGRLSGTASFDADGKTVVLDPELAKAMARRMVSVYEARHDPGDDTVTYWYAFQSWAEAHGPASKKRVQLSSGPFP